MSAALDPCRPFTTDDVTERPPVIRTSPTVAPAEPTELVLAIDRAQQWASRHLSAVVRLAHWGPYLDAGGAGHIVAGRLALAAVDLAESADELAAIVADLLAAAGVKP